MHQSYSAKSDYHLQVLYSYLSEPQYPLGAISHVRSPTDSLKLIIPDSNDISLEF